MLTINNNASAHWKIFVQEFAEKNSKTSVNFLENQKKMRPGLS
jgi:hypothetical protein